MIVDHYLVSYMSGRQEMNEFVNFVRQSVETEFIISDLDPYTFGLFTIVAEYQGKLGPEVCIGLSTGKYNVHVCSECFLHICTHIYYPGANPPPGLFRHL